MPVEEQETDLVFIVLVEEQEGDVYGPTPSNAKDGVSKGRKRVATSQGCLPPSGVESDYDRRGSGVLFQSRKVPKTTMLDKDLQLAYENKSQRRKAEIFRRDAACLPERSESLQRS